MSDPIQYAPENFCAVCEKETAHDVVLGSYRDPFAAPCFEITHDSLPFRKCRECDERRLTEEGWSEVLKARPLSDIG